MNLFYFGVAWWMILVLTYPRTIQEIRIGCLTGDYDMLLDLTSVNIAVKRAKSQGMLKDENVTVVCRPSTCDPKSGTTGAMDLILKDNVDVVTGTFCPIACESMGYVTSYWNTAFVTAFCTDPDLDNSTAFDTMVRLLGSSTSGYEIAFVNIFQKYNWNRVVLVSDTAADVCYDVMQRLRTNFDENNITVAIWIELSATPTDSDFEDYLNSVRDHGRIVIICHSAGTSELLKFLWKAQDLGMANGDYAYFTFENFPNTNITEPWVFANISDNDLNRRMEIFQTLKQVTYEEYVGDSENSFYSDVKKQMPDEVNSTFTKPGLDQVFLHDSVYLYLALANQLIVGGKSYTNGVSIVNQSRRANITGVSGNIIFNNNGNRLQKFVVWAFNETSTSFYVYLEIDRGTDALDELTDVVWGQFNTPPLDVPECGLQNELCPSYLKADDSLFVVASSVGGSIGALGVLFAAIFIARSKRTEMKIKQMSWRLSFEELEFLKTPTNSSISTSARTTATVSSSKSSLSDGAVVEGQPGTGRCTALCRGMIVSVHFIPKEKLHFAKKDLIELFHLKELVHDNLVTFVGACVDPGHACVVTQACSRGCLQDVLADEKLELDWTFKISFVTDIVKGMCYLHKSFISSHGNLSSSNCVINNRWLLKITGFGLHALHGEMVDNSDDGKCRDQLWAAPELLRMFDVPVCGSQKGDVYSFAIILHEIIFRTFPYSSTALKYSDIIERVKHVQYPPFRPQPESNLHSKTESKLVSLMEQCWSEESQDRPTFDDVEKTLKLMNRGKKLNIVDNMLDKLEKYANNLESVIQQRTGELMEEKQKTDMLLQQMLPHFIADELKAGRQVEPRVYSSVTVYFSDIVGFTTLSSESTPMQVVDFLNDLYGTFDDTISKHDVYKVETIGDAYMVASGLPKVNHRHVVEISNMALDLLNIVKTFKIRHRPDKMLMLRIGMHSGPCAAGVVGHTMPRYCLFGDTVNVASRMESNGAALKIHLSCAAHKELLSFPEYITEYRGEMEIKGKGLMKTYWLIGMAKREA